MAYSPLALPDGPVTIKFPRWATATPDGRKLVFQAVGRVWSMDVPGGTPHRLTPESFEPLVGVRGLPGTEARHAPDVTAELSRHVASPEC